MRATLHYKTETHGDPVPKHLDDDVTMRCPEGEYSAMK